MILNIENFLVKTSFYQNSTIKSPFSKVRASASMNWSACYDDDNVNIFIYSLKENASTVYIKNNTFENNFSELKNIVFKNLDLSF